MSSYIFTALSELTAVVAPVLQKVGLSTLTNWTAWRPPEWNGRALTSLTVPASDSTGAQVYVFDAVFRIDHVRELRRTEHPIQTSSASQVGSITDHAFRMPARVTLDIGMSDAMQSFRPGMWFKKASKSLSAYQTLVELQQKRTLVTLTTRLDTYSNMLIESIAPCDTVQTLHGLRAQVVFSQVFLAEVTASGTRFLTGAENSDRPQITQFSPGGVVQSSPVGQPVADQFEVSPSISSSLGAKIPGAGSWSSVSPKRFGGLF